MTVCYKKNAALQDFSYGFENGVYGILGPNGSGKSTLLNVIVGNVSPTRGRIIYDGVDVKQLGRSYRNSIGYMPQDQPLYDRFSVNDYLYYFAALKNVERTEADRQIRRLLSVTQMIDCADRKIGTLSIGMKQRVLFSQAMLGNPRIIILDEPTVGLDFKERMTLRNYIYQMAKERIVIMSTHIVSDVEFIARDIIFLNKGVKILNGNSMSVAEVARDKVYERELTISEYISFNSRNHQNRIIANRNGKVIVRYYGDGTESARAVNGEVGLEDACLCLYEYK